MIAVHRPGLPVVLPGPASGSGVVPLPLSNGRQEETPVVVGGSCCRRRVSVVIAIWSVVEHGAPRLQEFPLCTLHFALTSTITPRRPVWSRDRQIVQKMPAVTV